VQVRPDATVPADRVRWALLLCWVLVVAATVLTGERASSWNEVESLVATGKVDAVRVVGELPERATGYGLVEVHWRHGLTGYRARVWQVRGRHGPGPDSLDEEVSTVLHQPPSTRLAALQPDLQVRREQQRSADSRLLGRMVPHGLGLLAALLFFAGLGVLIAGPQPWRATRWAWFWLQVPPVGSIVFLLASGPVPGLRRPRRPGRRLTGGWAFLLSIPLASVLTGYRW
ncbi:MAG TPA: hypothetical protein VFH54_16515, partial [Mycobacteriales bacterium]|nr:hypothetical protein [Mycobacteriales bacterium]